MRAEEEYWAAPTQQRSGFGFEGGGVGVGMGHAGDHVAGEEMFADMVLGLEGQPAGKGPVGKQAAESLDQGLGLLKRNGEGRFFRENQIVLLAVHGDHGVADAHGFQQFGLPHLDGAGLDKDIDGFQDGFEGFVVPGQASQGRDKMDLIADAALPDEAAQEVFVGAFSGNQQVGCKTLLP